MIGEAFRRLQDGWPPLVLQEPLPFICGCAANDFTIDCIP